MTAAEAATRIVIAIPWRPQPGRLAAHAFVRSWWARTVPSATIIEVDTDHDEYNLAAARNLGVAQAQELGADVVVLADADVVITPDHHVHAAIADAPVTRTLHMPFTNQRYLSEVESERLYAGHQVPVDGHQGNGCCYIVTPDAYWACGGSDERFSGWGGDDDQLVAAATTLIGLTRHDGVALSLWHPAVRDVGSERHRPNSLLAQRYWRAMHDPAAMRALIAERP